MKGKTKPHSQKQRNNFRVDFTDYPQQEPKLVARVEKRFFTSKQEDIG